jgi:hypothetical protein
MKSSSIKFLITVFVVTVACVALQMVWNRQAPENYHLLNGYVLLGFFSLSITAIHLFLVNSAKGEPQGFIRKYMASTVFKFMFYMLLLIVLLLYTSDNKTILILHFLFYYAVFTVLEVGFLYNELRKLKR